MKKVEAELVVQEQFNTQKLLTVKDIQEILQIKKDKAYKLVHTKGFPTITIGREIRVPEQELNEWIKKYTYSSFKM